MAGRPCTASNTPRRGRFFLLFLHLPYFRKNRRTEIAEHSPWYKGFYRKNLASVDLIYVDIFGVLNITEVDVTDIILL